MRKRAGVLMFLVLAACGPTVAAGPSLRVNDETPVEEPLAACRAARETVRGFIAEMQLYGPAPGTDYEAWWNTYMTQRVADFAESFEFYAADCPAIAP